MCPSTCPCKGERMYPPEVASSAQRAERDNDEHCPDDDESEEPH